MNIIYVPIGMKNKIVRNKQLEYISQSIEHGWVRGGTVTLKDKFGTEVEVVILKFEREIPVFV